MAPQIRNRRGISNVVATIILIAVAIALAVAVAVWVFGLAGSSAKTATLNVQALGLSIGSPSPSTSQLTLVLSNPSSSSIGINGFTLGGLTCTFSTAIAVPPGTQGAQLTITLPASNGGSVSSGTQVSSTYVSGVVAISGSGGLSTNSLGGSCIGSVTLTAGVQYSGELTTTSGQTYPFTVSS
ncbi:MAG: archaellin/type IV pilin N-terminal domain-containing protein [Thermocladium sp.]